MVVEKRVIKVTNLGPCGIRPKQTKKNAMRRPSPPLSDGTHQSGEASLIPQLSRVPNLHLNPLINLTPPSRPLRTLRVLAPGPGSEYGSRSGCRRILVRTVR